MTAPKFTPGPWKITRLGRNTKDYQRLYVEAMAEDAEQSVCVEIQTFDENVVRPIDEANAHLISSAPDLYAALEAMLSCAEEGDLDSMANAAVAARKALDKANG